MIGETLAHYRIDALLGSGGMGVVYRAHDERLHRTVALKLVGGAEGGSTPEHRARLLDEARAASHLNHPHICTVYEVGEDQGRAFIAMEYVGGRPLSHMVPSGGLPPETVVRLGGQVAAALAHAHERGVVHRDLKTQNVVVNDEQGIKVLDFGLARRIEQGGTDEVTKSIARTEGGKLFGTLAYIAPEILSGQPADARSDIWSLGVVLYEMATGELPFKGRTEFELTAAILRGSAHQFPTQVPPMLRAIILRCVAKEPAHRYQRAGEVRAALEAIQSDPHVSVPDIDRPRRRAAWIVGTVLAAIAGVATWVALRPVQPAWEDRISNGRLTRIVSTELQTFDPVLSADGRMLCYAAESASGQIDLFTMRVAGGGQVQLTNDAARESSPKFSPDGERVVFMRIDGTDGAPEIRIVPSLGGEPAASIPNAAYPAWSPDGRRLVYLKRSTQAAMVDLTISAPDGTNSRALMQSDSMYPFLRNPAWSPDGQQVAIVRGSGGVAAEIWLVPLDGGAPRRALEEPASVFADSPTFTADGRGIVHTSNRGGATNIWFLPLRRGGPVRLTTGTGPDDSPSVSASGALAFVNSRWRNTLDLHDLSMGVSRTLLSHSPYLWSPAVSPDGREIAFSRSEEDGAWHVWTITADGSAPRRLTSGDDGEVYPRYSADGTFLTFHTWTAPRRVGRVPSHGGASTVLPLASGAGFADVASDGSRIAFTRPESSHERIYTSAVDGSDTQPLTESPGAVPRWSPDGSLIAFAGDRSYSRGIFVIGRDGKGERRLTADGGWPVWWPDGRQIAYLGVGRDGNQEIRVTTLDGQSRTLPVKLTGTNHPFAVFADGRRLMVTNAVHISDEVWLLEPGK